MNQVIYFLVLFFTGLSLNAQQINNIHFEQVGKQIHIHYDLQGEGSYNVNVFCSEDSGGNWGSSLVSVTGAIGKKQGNGTSKVIIWEVLDEKDSINGIISFKIVASNTNYSDIYIKEKNIYASISPNKTVQITSLNSDKNLIVNKDTTIIYFVRETGNIVEDPVFYIEVEQESIMTINLVNLKEELLTDTIFFKDRDHSVKLTVVTPLVLTENDQYLFFMTAKWSVSGVLVRLDTKTNQQVEISHADGFSLINKGRYINHLIVYRSSVKKNKGRQWSNYLMDFNGNVIEEIGDENAVINFKKEHEYN